MREPAFPDVASQTETIEGYCLYLEYKRGALGCRVMELNALKEQAERCRRLAKHADPFTQKRLLDLASE
jgi:hypothetical protein